ncbi:hypothetical protein DASC09_028970 [Saccharomycopsis crataegensis]|uniref:Uncharacterized protein n=1 Tax=Saccharomycopsis crataegensis TaxID=43959 RepID=A0AAV5QLZ4_9ASCO|nr:hypothetical protein DASC09_028970 [Saccharomycopsis crataegensis]
MENSLNDYGQLTKTCSESLWKALWGIVYSAVPEYHDVSDVNKAELTIVESSVELPLNDNVIADEFLKPYYEAFIGVVPKDDNQRLYIEMAFTAALQRFENAAAATNQQKESSDDDNDRQQRKIDNLKLNFYSVIIDFANYLVNNDNHDAQNDLGFILVSNVIELNTIRFIKKFWCVLETRHANLIKFLSFNNGEYMKKSGTRSLVNTVRNRYIVGLRRPGAELSATLKKLIQRMENPKDSVFEDDSLFLGRVYLYIFSTFAINDDLFSDHKFKFNRDFIRDLKSQRKFGDVHFFRFWQLKNWLSDPIDSEKNAYLLKDQRAIVSEIIDSFDRDSGFRDSYKQGSADELKNFVENGDAKFVDDFYHQELHKEKMDYYSDSPLRFNSVGPLYSFATFRKQKFDDVRFRLETLVQILIITEYMTNLAERYKKERFDEVTKLTNGYNEYIKQLQKQSEENSRIPLIAPVEWTKFKGIYSTLPASGRDYDYYLGIRKAIKEFFNDHCESLGFTVGTCSTQNDAHWFFWKLHQFSIFNITPDFEVFKKSIEDVKLSLSKSNTFENSFGIKFGNRNLTKIFSSRPQLSTASSNLETNESLKQKSSQGDISAEYHSLGVWKNSRLNRQKRTWLAMEVPEISEEEIMQFKNKLSKNDRLRQQLEEIRQANKSLMETVSKKSKTIYVSVSRDDDDPNTDDPESMTVGENTVEQLDY